MGLWGAGHMGEAPLPTLTPLTGPPSYLPPPVQETRKKEPPSKAVGSGTVTRRGTRPPGSITGRKRGWLAKTRGPLHPPNPVPPTQHLHRWVSAGGWQSLCLCLFACVSPSPPPTHGPVWTSRDSQ